MTLTDTSGGAMNWILDILSLIGSGASCLGIYLTWRQMKKVKTISEATHVATESVVSLFSMVELTKHCELIKSIQESLRSEEMKLALYKSQQLKSSLIDLLDYIEKENFNNAQIDLLREGYRVLGLDILNIHNNIIENSRRLNLERIIQNLELLSDTMQQLQANLKNKQLKNHE